MPESRLTLYWVPEITEPNLRMVDWAHEQVRNIAERGGARAAKECSFGILTPVHLDDITVAQDRLLKKRSLETYTTPEAISQALVILACHSDGSAPDADNQQRSPVMMPRGDWEAEFVAFSAKLHWVERSDEGWSLADAKRLEPLYPDNAFGGNSAGMVLPQQPLVGLRSPCESPFAGFATVLSDIHPKAREYDHREVAEERRKERDQWVAAARDFDGLLLREGVCAGESSELRTLQRALLQAGSWGNSTERHTPYFGLQSHHLGFEIVEAGHVSHPISESVCPSIHGLKDSDAVLYLTAIGKLNGTLPIGTALLLAENKWRFALSELAALSKARFEAIPLLPRIGVFRDAGRQPNLPWPLSVATEKDALTLKWGDRSTEIAHGWRLREGEGSTDETWDGEEARLDQYTVPVDPKSPWYRCGKSLLWMSSDPIPFTFESGQVVALEELVAQVKECVNLWLREDSLDDDADARLENWLASRADAQVAAAHLAEGILVVAAPYPTFPDLGVVRDSRSSGIRLPAPLGLELRDHALLLKWDGKESVIGNGWRLRSSQPFPHLPICDAQDWIPEDADVDPVSTWYRVGQKTVWLSGEPIPLECVRGEYVTLEQLVPQVKECLNLWRSSPGNAEDYEQRLEAWNASRPDAEETAAILAQGVLALAAPWPDPFVLRTEGPVAPKAARMEVDKLFKTIAECPLNGEPSDLVSNFLSVISSSRFDCHAWAAEMDDGWNFKLKTRDHYWITGKIVRVPAMPTAEAIHQRKTVLEIEDLKHRADYNSYEWPASLLVAGDTVCYLWARTAAP